MGCSENIPDQVGGVDNGGRLAGVLTVPGTDRHADYVHAVQKLPDTDHVGHRISEYVWGAIERERGCTHVMNDRSCM